MSILRGACTGEDIEQRLSQNYNPVELGNYDGRTATGKWALIDLVTLIRKDTGEKDSIAITADYADTFVKIANGEWRFQSIRADLKLLAPLPALGHLRR